MYRHIHNKLLIRLGTVAVILSIIISLIVYYIEIENVDQYVLRLTAQESRAITQIPSGNMDKEESMSLLKNKMNDLLHSHFIGIELYDPNKNLVSESVRENDSQVEDILNHFDKHVMLDQTQNYKRFDINGKLYMQAIIPVSGNPVIGWFEGIYEVDSQTLDEIHNRVTLAVIQTIIVVIGTTAILYPVILSLSRSLVKQNRSLMQGNLDLMRVLGNAVSKRDNDTFVHNYRVTLYAVDLAEAMGVGREETLTLIKGAFLHDIGKIGISDAILLKQGKLTAEEYAVMKQHVQYGVEIASAASWITDAIGIIQNHHEKIDGTGYPAGRCYEEIPLLARIFSIADVFDALTSRRPYKEPMSVEEALAIMEKEKGRHFDSMLFDQFRSMIHPLYRELTGSDDTEIERRFNRKMEDYI